MHSLDFSISGNTLAPFKPKPFHGLLTNKTNWFLSFPITSKQQKLHAKATKGDKFPASLQRQGMPEHVAVIMDGNRRWAEKRGLPVSSGHEAGELAFREIIELSHKWGIQVLTFFWFSHDNWNRPQDEVDFLMMMFERVIHSHQDYFMSEGMKISKIGESRKLPTSLQKAFTNAQEMTKDNNGLHVIFAIGYSGQYDIVQACKSITHKVKDELIGLEDINETLIEHELETNCTEFPHPDLLIRTSGELRVSNFMLWQLAYSELYFAPALWPDFGEADYIEALASFQQRKRRYGKRDA